MAQAVTMVLLTTTLTAGAIAPWSAVVLAALCAVGVALLLWRFARLRGTTLTGAWWWAVGSLTALALCETWLAMLPGETCAAWASPLRLVAATSTFCPGVFVLGARRPHAGAWHFVVLSMWVMLALPAVEALFLGRGMTMELGPIRGWFLWIAIGIVSLNYLPTRHGVSALLVAGGQVILLSPYLPLLANSEIASGGILARELCGVALLVAAIAVAVWRSRSAGSKQLAERVAHAPLDAAWLSCRDMFGGLWALRVLERMNFASRTYGWPMALGWSGFYFHDPASGWGDVNEEVQAEVRKTLDNLRRRFVDVRELGD
jgi:hypothetical protein